MKRRNGETAKRRIAGEKNRGRSHLISFIPLNSGTEIKEFDLRKAWNSYAFAALNTHHFPFEKIHEAFDVAIHDKESAFKVMLTF